MRDKLTLKQVLAHPFLWLLGIIVILILVIGGVSRRTNSTTSSQTKTASTRNSQTTSSSIDDLPKGVKTTDWDLVLVNRDHTASEMNPDVTTIDGVAVDSRIASATRQFLAVAQAIDSSEHLISGYRSVAYQESLFNNYVSQEMAADPSLTEKQAEDKVKTYSQPAGASEHMTGLAIDMSTVDSLNESDPSVVSKLKEIAPQYGFVLRFEEDKTSSTGVDYEDWHWRYVGVKNAEYMTKHHLSLEEYIALLERGHRT